MNLISAHPLVVDSFGRIRKLPTHGGTIGTLGFGNAIQLLHTYVEEQPHQCSRHGSKGVL